MSNAYSRASRKRRRTKVQKTPSKMTEQEKLFAELSRKWGSGKLHKQLKKEKHFGLLKRISRGACYPQEAHALINKDYENNRLDQLFQLDDSTPRVLHVDYLCLPDCCLKSAVVMAIRTPGVREHVNLIIPGSRPIRQYRASHRGYAVISERKTLPADMRKWDASLAASYLRVVHRHASFGPTASTSGLHPGKLIVESLVQLRRTNPFPSSKQRRQEHNKSYEKRAQEIDVSFSHGQ